MSTLSDVHPLAHLLPSSLVAPRSPLRRSRPWQQERTPVDAAEAPLICFCHLPWNGVWQRPQQLMSRLAWHHEVLFVETYCSEVAASRWEAQRPAGHPQITVLAMHLPARRWMDGAFIDAERSRLLADFRRQHPGLYDRPILWFNDPMAVVAFGSQAEASAIVYDCMDELAQFKGAPPELREREKQLLRLADVVFCGGRKMRDRRLPLNPNCHFYGTGVDFDHFGAACGAGLAIPADLAALDGPKLGYFGVIDERIDYDLLTRLAEADPAWQVVMIGPVAKIDPRELPQRQNLHWLGPRPYSQLPAYTKGFAVCLMPFARNAATEFINPTKALEYFATGRPVVSTDLDEVRTNFAPACAIAGTREEFVRSCQEQVRAPDHRRIAAGLRLARAQSWESIVEQMERHLYAARLKRSRQLGVHLQPVLRCV